MAPPCPSQFSAKVSHLLSHSYRVTVVYLAPCGRKCLVSLMASSKDPSIYSACSRPGELLCVSSWTLCSQNVHAVKFNMYAKIQHWWEKKKENWFWFGVEEDALCYCIYIQMLRQVFDLKVIHKIHFKGDPQVMLLWGFQRQPNASLTRCFLTFWASPRRNPL